MTGKKQYYFISDLHLGSPDHEQSLKREKQAVTLLDDIADKATEIYLLGDIFDFWYEWKHVIPKGFVRFFGKIAELSDAGIIVRFFPGNHDLWAKDYFKKEMGMYIHHSPFLTDINAKKLYIAHGDGLGNYDKTYNLLKKIFCNKFLQWCFSRLHPNLAISIAQYWSGKSRQRHPITPFLGEEKEWLIQYSKELLHQYNINYFIYGHRHLPDIRKIGNYSKYINLGDWLEHFTYAVFDGESFSVMQYYPEHKPLYTG